MYFGIDSFFSVLHVVICSAQRRVHAENLFFGNLFFLCHPYYIFKWECEAEEYIDRDREPTSVYV